jgi:lipopolysaccharide/colanic/teichoic acid biosynthesis glycosyltransferase
MLSTQKTDKPLLFPEMKEYSSVLRRRRFTLACKRCFDIVFSGIGIILLSPALLALSLAIKIDSKGPVFYRQSRVGRNNRDFQILKFRTILVDSDKIGPPLTLQDDPRITKVGRFIRKYRLDEFSQLFNVFAGSMSLVGPRPEVRKYVDAYKPEYMATLLVRPGITAPASIAFKDEGELLRGSKHPEQDYIEKILPKKMELNLKYIRELSFWGDIRILFNTFFCLFTDN